MSTYSTISDHHVGSHTVAVITGARRVAIPDASNGLDFSGEGVNDGFGAIDGSLFAARAGAWDVWVGVATTSTVVTAWHAAL